MVRDREDGDASTPDLVGRDVGPYRILSVLGRGGMGTIYRARDLRLDREVALKFLSRERAASPDAVARLRREARAASALSHPNVCTLLDVGEDEGRSYLVMELIEGVTLRDLIGLRPLRIADAVRIAEQVADGLEAAHQKGILHRDIKPENILVDERGRARILDFGIAKLGPLPAASTDTTSAYAGPSSESLTDTGVLVGTVAYMSPEQACGERLDARSDVFSLGAVLYEMLTGERAFRGRTRKAVLEAIVDSPVEPPSARRPDLPAELERIVLRALEKERELRYQTAADLRADLSRLERDLASADSARRRAPPGRRRPRWTVAAALAALVGAVALLAARICPREGRALPGSTVVAVLPLVTGEAARDGLSSGVVDVLIGSLAKTGSVNVLSRWATEGLRADRRRDRSALVQELGADYFVEGAVQRAGGRYRLTLSLFNARTELVAWSERYDADASGFLDTQLEASQALAVALGTRLSARARQEIEDTRPRDLESFELYSRAAALLDRPDVPENANRAVALLQEAVERDPGFVLAHAALGQACWRRYEATLDTAWLARARQAIDTALELDPAQPLIRLARARVFESEGRPGEAIQELRTVQRLQPGNDASHRQLGLIHLRGGRTDEALEELRQAVALRPEYWANHQDLGVALFRAGHFSQAADEFERVTVLKPENAWGHQMLGTAHHAQGDTARALESYRRAVELTPDAGAYTNMGIIHYSEGRLPEAIADFERAARLEPGQLLMHRNLGDAYRRAGRRREAEASYREAVRLGRLELNANPRSAETLAAVAVCEAKLGRFPDARAHAAAAVALAPEHSDVLYDRAVVQSLAGDLEEALASLATAIDRGYSPSQAREDEDLAPLRGSPRFEELVGVAPAT